MLQIPFRAVLFCFLLTSTVFADSQKAEQFYEEKVKPILEKNCLRCHGAKPKIRGGLRLTNRADILKGGDTGPAVLLKQPEKSLLIDVIHYRKYEMPPTGKLPKEKIAILTEWVKMGIPGLPEKGEVVAEHGPPQVNEKTKAHWAFRPVTRPLIPRSRGDMDNPIDAFLLARMNQEELSPVDPARPEELIRRLYYDVIGLPPSPEEVEQFRQSVKRNPDTAVEQLVDRLLASPHFGEKWARHWLDLVRYAESNSYERDNPKPFVWRYRDYVIRSFNNDKPYDQFIREQLAGDEFAEVTRDSLIATGYYRLGIWDDEPVDKKQALFDDLDDILATTSQVLMGLTINCARCHDHKLDPIPTEDYYRMLAFFSGLNRYGIRGANTVAQYSLRPIGGAKAVKEAREAERHKRRAQVVNRRIDGIERIVRGSFTPLEKEEFQTEAARIPIVKKRVPKLLTQKELEEYIALTRERDVLRRVRPKALEMALCVTEIGSKARDMHIMIRGNANVEGKRVEPGFLSVLSPPEPVIEERPTGSKTSGRRLALAKWISDKKHPLTTRVMVNRLWHYYFGQGLVRSPNNFGLKGMAPSHPRLLDWLASELVRNEWRLKPIHRLILLSRAYQLSSQASPTVVERDPENQFFARQNMRRLSAEEVRDSILAVSGRLNRGKMHGPSIYPIIPREVLAGQSRPGNGWGNSSPEDRSRRSIYVHIKRSLLVPILESFDAADTDFSCPVRFTTTQPTQALGMLNGDFLGRQAQFFADDLFTQASDAAERVSLALRKVFQRQPSEAEVSRGVKLIGRLQTHYGLNEREATARFCLVALNLNEFLYLD